MPLGLEVINLDEARYECTFGRGCDGVCCRTGRPPLTPPEVAKLDAHLPRFLDLLRPAARAAIRRSGYLLRCSRRRPRLRIAAGWCVFFRDGCVLHRAGLAEGDKFKYKPALCAVFPLSQNERGRWYVRQKGYDGEIWDLPCLDPTPTTTPAAESLREELALAATLPSAAGPSSTTRP
jgi:hypothetical protein